MKHPHQHTRVYSLPFQYQNAADALRELKAADEHGTRLDRGAYTPGEVRVLMKDGVWLVPEGERPKIKFPEEDAGGKRLPGPGVFVMPAPHTRKPDRNTIKVK